MGDFPLELFSITGWFFTFSLEYNNWLPQNGHIYHDLYIYLVNNALPHCLRIIRNMVKRFDKMIDKVT